MDWPALPFDAWKDSFATIHRLSQILGKVRLAQTPVVNHWWNSALLVGPRGLRTGATPYAGGLFEMELDFVDHSLRMTTDDGRFLAMPLVPRPIAACFADVQRMLDRLGVEAEISDKPCEIAEDAIPFAQDTKHGQYDPAAVERWWTITKNTSVIFEEVRARFIGKSSPVLFWWGSFDLAVTRFSGRRAPPRPGADSIQREAYSHEVSSAGFWPGTADLGGPAYYAYTVPAPPGLEVQRVVPQSAWFDKGLGEFLLRYDDVRNASDPRAMLLAFLQSTYEAGARLAGWDRANLERTSSELQVASRIPMREFEPEPVSH